MADRDYEINVRITGESGGLSRDLEEVGAAVNNLKKDLGDLNRQLEGATASIRGVRDNARALAVDLGYAERAMQSLTRYTRMTRDDMADLDKQVRETDRGFIELDASTGQLARAQEDLASRLDAVVIPSFDHMGSILDQLSRRMIMTGSTTNELARAQREAAIAAELEARALADVGDQAEEAAAKVAMLKAEQEALSRSSVAGGLMSRLGSFIGGADLRGILYHQGAGANLPWWLGGGLLGAVGAGGLLPMTGLGPERFVTAGLALGGSAAGALGGAGALGLGALGTMAVGGGSDLAVMKSTIADTQTLYQQYNALNQAVAVYGKNSTQAKDAQNQLNYSLQQLGPAAGAEFKLALAVANLNKVWDQVTAKARSSAVSILDQVVQLGHDYVGKVAQAAYENLTVINQDIKPLFAWLEGPTGMGIWNDLEKRFKENLPTAVHAFTQAVELLLRVVDGAAPYVGHFVDSIDKLLTKWNQMSNSRLDSIIARLVNDFEIWLHFLEAVGRDVWDLFKAGANEGNDLLQLFTKWLDEFNKWETSVKGQEWLHNFFKQRAAELVAILQILPPIITSFGRFYMALQPLVPVWTAIAKAIAATLGYLDRINPAAATAVAGMIMFRKFIPNPFAGGGGGGGVGLISTAEADAAAASRTGAAGTADALDVLTGTSIASGAMDAAKGIMAKIGPMLKLGAAFWIGTGIISGISDVNNNSQYFKMANVGSGDYAIQNTANKLTFGLTGALGLDPAGQAVNQAKATVQKIIAEVQNQFSSTNWSGIDSLATKIRQMAGEGVTALDPLINKIEYLKNVTTGLGTVTPAMAEKIITSFQQVRSEGGSEIQNMQQIVQTNMQMIEQDVGTGSRQAKQDLTLNFYAAARFMEGNYVQMGISTQKAMQFINQMLVNALHQLGVSKIPGAFQSNTSILTSSYLAKTEGFNISQGGLASPSAQGGIFGNPNAAGRDMYHVVLGEGEAVLTRHQRSAIDAALPGGMSVSGVVGSITRPHYAAQGFDAAGGGAAMPGNIPNIQVQGLGAGIIDMIAQTAVDDYHAAAEAFLGQKTSAAGPGGGFTGPGGGRTSAGGQYNKAALERLWDSAGGSPAMANLMAAIALAESGGNPSAHNPSGATGLWQILGNPFPGNAYDPMTNARMAVSKEESQGLGAWVTYTSGAYRAFMNQGGIIGADTGFASAAAYGNPHLHGHPPPLRKPPRLPAVRGINGFNYLYGIKAVDQPVIKGWPLGKGNDLNAALRLINYAGGNAQAITDAGDFLSLLQGELGAINQTDAQGNPITDPKYAYGQNFFYPGDPSNPGGYVGVWGVDQQIAAAMGILAMMQGEKAGAPGEISRLGKYVHAGQTSMMGIMTKALTLDSQIKGLASKQKAGYWSYSKAKKNWVFVPPTSVPGLSSMQTQLSRYKNNISTIWGNLVSAESGYRLDTSLYDGMSKLGIQKSNLNITSPDVLSSIQARISLLAGNSSGGIPYYQDVAIPTLDNQRTQVTGSPSTTNTALYNDQILAGLYQQAGANAATDAAVQGAQLKVLAGFTPLIGAMVGSFAGGGVIPETGYALVHRGETVSPDPEGPYGTQPGISSTRDAPNISVEPTIVLSGSLAPMSQFVEAVVEKTAQRYVSSQTGAKARILAGAPGR